MRRLWQAHSGSLPAACPRHAVARGLPQMWLLWLSPRRSWLHAVHQGQSNALQARLLEVSSSTRRTRMLHCTFCCNWMLMPPFSFLLDYLATQATVLPAAKSFQPSRWWCVLAPMFITWSALRASNAIIGESQLIQVREGLRRRS